jgi:iron(III) transport system substrate-binding protein
MVAAIDRMQRQMRMVFAGSLAAAIALALGLTIAPAAVASVAPEGFGRNLSEVVARAKKEGKVRFCAGTPDEKEAKEFFRGFREKYPDITIEYTRCRPAQTSERILTELIAGQVEYDLLTVYDALIPQYKKAGVLAGPFDWIGIFGMRPAYVSPDKFFVSSGSSMDAIVYNPKLVPKERVPRSWESCLDPYWQGKFVVDTRGSAFIRLYPVWGKEKLVDFARRLAANKPVWKRGQTEVMQEIANGEYLMMCGAYLSSALTLLAQDPAMNLAISIPKEMTADGYATLGVAKKARNPNAALLLAGYLATDEGQRAYRVGFRESPFDESTETGRRIKEAGAKVFYTGWDLTPDIQNEVTRMLRQAWGFPAGQVK